MAEMNIDEFSGLVIIQMDGKRFLGNVKKEKEGILIENALESTDLKNYLMKKNLGELTTVTFRGNGSFIETPLDDDQKLQLKVYVEKMNEAKKKGIMKMENDLFQKMF